MLKVRAHGIDGLIANWIEEWLKNRKQRVVLNGKESDWMDVMSGVPQGSVLGPCLFLIYINDIDSAIDSVLTLLKKFADDTKIASVTDTQAHCENLQLEIDKLVKWADKWLMSFNTDKCVVMHLGSKNLKHSYHMNNVPMKTTECERDIGVYMHTSLKPSVQTADAVKKANRALGRLLRGLTYRDKYHYIRLYKQYVRCHLEYAVQAWCPWTKQDIELIESVQKRAIRMCYGLHGSYEEKLKSVGLTKLTERRERGDMLETFKILKGIEDTDYHNWFNVVSECHQKTRHAVDVLDDGSTTPNLNLVKPKAHLELRKNFFSHRVINSWNNLPSSVKDAKNAEDFKVKYDRFNAGN